MKLLMIFFSMFFVLLSQAATFGGNLNLASGTSSTSYKDQKGKSVVLLSGSATLDVHVKVGLGRRVLTLTDSQGNQLSFTIKAWAFKNKLDINVNQPNLKITTTVVTRTLNEKYERPGRIEESYDCSTYTTDSDGNSVYNSQTCYDYYPSIDVAQDYDVQYKFSFIINGQPLEFIHSKTTTKIFSQRKVKK